MSIDLPHARETLAHRIAACVHAMLAERGMTASELKYKLSQFPAPHCQPECVDAILTATDSDKVTLNDLADVAWALEFEWDFQIRKLPEAAPDEEVGHDQ